MLLRGQRRPRCASCWLSDEDCVCGVLPRLDNRVEVAVIAHAHDLARPSNTARFVPRMLSRASLHAIGGRIDREARPLAIEAEGALVLHPDGRPLRAEDAATTRRLIVPDGTWRQVRRMLKRLPLLHAFETVSVAAPERSSLAIRRGPRAHHVSTLEAVALALGVLESPEIEREMLAVLAKVVSASLRRRSPAVVASLP
jgi:DTW domain-containing protein YfiP